jgi:alkanesulfonate monooxygenase SsuD/methylene tetrahydromethanopterin reductase-like flavin-dependent oxidoreductase (luciferase family)
MTTDIQALPGDFVLGIAIPAPDNGIRDIATAAQNLAIDFLIVTETVESGACLELTSVLGFLAPRTTIGLVAEFDVTYVEPFFVSRTLATLDHVATGRIGWQLKIDSSDEAAHSRGLPAPLPLEELTERVVEFIAVVRDLWDSWDDDAIVRDKARGIFIRADRVHHLNHTGRYFAVRGPAVMPRPPQGHLPTFVTLTDAPQSLRLARAVGEVIRLRTTSADQVSAARREFPQARILVDIPFTSLRDTLAVLDAISGVAHGIVVEFNGLDFGEAPLQALAAELAKRGLRTSDAHNGTLRERLGLPAAVNRLSLEGVR